MLSSAQEPTSSPDADEISDEELVARVLAGELTYFVVLYNRYSQKIYTFAVYSTDHETGEDITQQTFMKAFENLGTLKKGEHFKPWLYRIAHNDIQDRQRRKRLRQWVPWREVKDEQVIDGLCVGTFGQDWEQELENKAFIHQTLQKVSPQYRDCTGLALC